MKYVLAVSGGVDSVVMLDMLVRAGEHDLVVAHFDHGIRPDASADARFVAALAEAHGLPYELGQGKLGPDASEEQARDARYRFLRRVAEKHDATIATAHHQGDIIETIAINLSRGTGWRGLAVLNDPAMFRPMLAHTKPDILAYACENGLEWVEDETNQSSVYLRNRIRRSLAGLAANDRTRIIDLWLRQRKLAHSIDQEAVGLRTTSRYFLTMIDEPSASEILRSVLAASSLSLTRPQRLRLLHAIKTGRSSTTVEAGSGARIDLTSSEFIVKHP